MKKAISQAKLYALAVMALLTVFSAPVVAQHDMSNMPGMNKPKPKPKPRRAAAKRKLPTETRPKQDDAKEMDNMSEPTPAPQPSSSPQPKAAPEPLDANMPGMKMPTTSSSPSPATSPAATPEKMEMPMPKSSPSSDANQSNAPQKHDMSEMEMGAPTKEGQPAGMNDSMPGMEMGAMGNMPMGPNSIMLMEDELMKICIGPGTRNTLPMGQMGSGSSWQPSTSPMYMYSKMVGNWTVFIHADAKLGVNSQGGPRGVTKFESENWVMPMAYRRVGPGTLQLRGMFSLEPFSLPPGGSPQLFQTGETYKGQPLIDQQHPHDLFMELSGTYTVALGDKGTWFTYLGFPGEPSLGPTAFMHRLSASENPSAPLAHHLQDSTHIAFGVFSTGFTYRGLKLEGSIFNGREPDENRYNFEFNPWNSRSARLSFAPNDNWSIQVSYGFLKNPEAHAPGDIRRTTASLSYNKHFARGNWAATIIWGRNHANHSGQVFNQNGYTAESTVNFLNKNYIYTRLELVDKNELLRDEDRALLGITDHHPSFRIGAYTLGAARDIWNTEKFSLALGSDLTFYSKPDALDSIYGNNPVSYKFFIRIRPRRMEKQ